jgi:pimeloyl-ACP methyl ester carboxylesterase
MQAVELPRAVFIGHSMGSAIVLTLALEQPNQVLGLGLVAASARMQVAPDLLDATENPTTFQTAIEMIISRSFGPQAPPRLKELAALRMAETRPSVLHGDFLACNTFDRIADIEQISQPALVICGTEDRMTPMRFAQFLADRMPNARLEPVPGAGHMVMLEQPQAVAVALRGFLDKISYV